MFKPFYGPYWALDPSAWPQVAAILAHMVKMSAGPVDDLESAEFPVLRVGDTAVIPINGIMLRSAPAWAWQYGVTSGEAVSTALRAARADDDIVNIVLAIDSPGGSVEAMIDIGDTLASVAKDKRVITQVNGTMASAALYVGVRAEKIYANRLDLVGSIGVKMALTDLSEAYAKAGIKAILIDTGEHKSAGEPGTPITDAQIAEFQRIVDGYFDDYIAVLAEGRGMSEAEARILGTGQMFFALDAIDKGLIDGLQSMSETLTGIARFPKESNSMHANRVKIMEMMS